MNTNIMRMYFIYDSSNKYSIICTYKKPILNVKNSLDGIQINNNNEHGLEYISCILEELRKSNENWKSLKKVKIQDMLKKILEKLVKDDLVSYNYQKKRQHLANLVEHKKLKEINGGVFEDHH